MLITGKGFELADDRPAAFCRFGVAANYAIVEAIILSYDKMVCRSPAEFPMPVGSEDSSALSVPVGVAFIDDLFNPWTESLHRYRMYKQPVLVRSDPDEVDIGMVAEVYVFTEGSDL